MLTVKNIFHHFRYLKYFFTVLPVEFFTQLIFSILRPLSTTICNIFFLKTAIVSIYTCVTGALGGIYLQRVQSCCLVVEKWFKVGCKMDEKFLYTG